MLFREPISLILRPLVLFFLALPLSSSGARRLDCIQTICPLQRNGNELEFRTRAKGAEKVGTRTTTKASIHSYIHLVGERSV